MTKKIRPKEEKKKRQEKIVTLDGAIRALGTREKERRPQTNGANETEKTKERGEGR